MSDSNRVALRFYEESAFGQFESGNPKFTAVRFTGESLNQATQSTTSQEIRSDRQIVDLIRTGVNAAGDINGELSYGSPPDDLLEAALQSSGFSTEQTAGPGTTFSVTAGSGSYTIADSGSGFGSFAVGQWVYISGFSDAANNGFAKITAASAGSITVSHNGNGVNDTAGDTVTITMGAQITNGTSLRTFNWEKEFTDLSNNFEQFAGMAIDTFGLNVTSDGIVTWTFGWLGALSQSNTATLGDGSPTAAATDSVMNAIDDVQLVFANGTSYDVTSFNFQIQNNLRARLQVGTLGAISLGSGTINATGAHQAYYNTITEMDAYLNDTARDFGIIFFKDTDAYVIEFPQAKYSSGQRVAGGINQDVLADMAFQAYRDASEDVTIRIAKFSGLS